MWSLSPSPAFRVLGIDLVRPQNVGDPQVCCLVCELAVFGFDGPVIDGSGGKSVVGHVGSFFIAASMVVLDVQNCASLRVGYRVEQDRGL
jgi:hypothetical protein